MNSNSVFAGRRVVVTGCAGFVGSHLAEALLNDGAELLGIDSFNDNYGRSQKLRNLRHLTDWEKFEFAPVDLAQGTTSDLIAERDVIFHLAAEPGVRTSWGDRYEQYLRNNVLATQHLLESLRSSPGARLVYASSSSVYGNSEIMPTPESARLRPRSPYGQTKVAMEHLCNLYVDNFGVDAVGLRYFTVFGPRQRPDMAFHRICRAALTGDEFTVFGDGRQTRDFTYVADVVAVTRAAAFAELDSERLFNIGGGSPASLLEVIDAVGQLAGRAVQVSFDHSEHGDVRDTFGDSTLAKHWLGFEPVTTLAAGVAAEYEWLADVSSGSSSSGRIQL